MSHQKDCFRLGVVSYCSNPSGDLVGPIVGVPEAILRHYDRVEGHATPQRLYTTAKTAHECSVLTTASDAMEIDEIVVMGVATLH